MTALPPSPFLSSAADPIAAADTAAASFAPSPLVDAAATRFDRHFDPEKFLRDIVVGLPQMSNFAAAIVTGDQYDKPLFLDDPTDDFITACQRDLLPVIEDHVRRAG